MASTITFQCYSCNQVLKVGSDKAGKKAKCIKCGTILTIPVASDEEEVKAGSPRKSPPPIRNEEEDRPRSRRSRDDDEDEDDRPRRRRDRDDEDDDYDRPRGRGRDEDDDDDYDRPRRRRSRDEDDDYEEDERYQKKKEKLVRGQMRSVETGLYLFYLKWFIFAIATGVVVGGQAVSLGVIPLIRSEGGLRFLLAVAGILGIAALVGLLAALILGIIGSCMTARVPAKTGFHGLGIAVLILECTAPGLGLLGLCMTLLASSFTMLRVALIVYIAAALCFLGGFIVYMIFLRGLAVYFKDKSTAKWIIVVMIMTLVTPFVGAALLWTVGTLIRNLTAVAVASLVILLITGVATVINYLQVATVTATVKNRI